MVSDDLLPRWMVRVSVTVPTWRASDPFTSGLLDYSVPFWPRAGTATQDGRRDGEVCPSPVDSLVRFPFEDSSCQLSWVCPRAGPTWPPNRSL
jgi:hypothetical protein